jgi:hypothetical protein
MFHCACCGHNSDIMKEIPCQRDKAIPETARDPSKRETGMELTFQVRQDEKEDVQKYLSIYPPTSSYVGLVREWLLGHIPDKQVIVRNSVNDNHAFDKYLCADEGRMKRWKLNTVQRSLIMEAFLTEEEGKCHRSLSEKTATCSPKDFQKLREEIKYLRERESAFQQGKSPSSRFGVP